MIYVIVGPTCSNKSEVAIKLSSLLSAPIINADAFQIYKDMDIGTAKISKDHPLYKNHYLLDIKLPSETYSVKEYQNDFRNTLNNLLSHYKDVIVCGGTGLYIKAALYDYEFMDEDEPLDLAKYDSLSDKELYDKLMSLDELEAKKLHQNNRKRVIRALEIITRTNEKKSEIISKQEHKLIYPDVRILFINPIREKLYENINKRVDIMFNKGLIDEVKSLKSNYELSMTSKAGIGYKEVLSYLDNEITLDECKELIKKRTRNYAKRQVTFFKNQFECEMFSSSDELLKEFINE